MQTGRTRGVERPTLLRLLIHIARTEGVVKGLYKGVTMNWIKGPIAVGISFASYDRIVMFLRQLPYFAS